MLVWLGLRPALPAFCGGGVARRARAVVFVYARAGGVLYIHWHGAQLGSFRFLSSMLVSSERSLPRVYGSRVESWLRFVDECLRLVGLLGL